MILETERLIIEELSIIDAAFIYELLNDPDWIKNIGDRKIKTIKDAENYLSERLIPSYKNWGFGFYKIALKDKTAIGIAGLVDRNSLEHIDIGYAFLPIGRGKGYAYESTKAILNYAKNTLELNTIVAIVNKNNEKSIKLLRKLGMHFEKYVTLPDEDKEICLFTTKEC